MIARINFIGRNFEVDLSNPIDISIPVQDGFDNPNCFYAPPVEFAPVVAADFIGSTIRGGAVNFYNIKINPHGNGTHTECVGHISQEKFTIHQTLKNFHFICKLVSVYPLKTEEGDRVILRHQLEEIVAPGEVGALIVRTMPNDDRKLQMNYSGSNPPYIHHEAMEYLVGCGVEHLLVDLPSVDREQDGGKLLGHKAFWAFPERIREKSTITELIYASNEIKDGLYLLNLHIASFELDASPSKPVLYKLKEV